LLKYDGDGHTLHYGIRTIDTKQFPAPAFNYYLKFRRRLTTVKG
jgi:hypothetical protein